MMKVTIIGAGNSGQATSAYLKMKGCFVTLYNRTKAVLDEIDKNNGIELFGKLSGKTRLDHMTVDIRCALQDTEIIFITIPADAHIEIIRKMEPFLKDGQIIILSPGRTGGSYAVYQEIARRRDTGRVIVAETDTVIFTCRLIANGKVNVFSRKSHLKLSAYYPLDTDFVFTKLSSFFPEMCRAGSVLETGLSNIGMLFHPAPFLFNIARIERKEHFLFYKTGITPLVSGYIEEIDQERLQIADKLSVPCASAKEWVQNIYGAVGKDLYETIQNAEVYNSVFAPSDIMSRYVFEDIGTGLVPLESLGGYLGINTPYVSSIIDLAKLLYHYDFRAKGRSFTARQIEELIHVGDHGYGEFHNDK